MQYKWFGPIGLEVSISLPSMQRLILFSNPLLLVFFPLFLSLSIVPDVNVCVCIMSNVNDSIPPTIVHDYWHWCDAVAKVLHRLQLHSNLQLNHKAYGKRNLNVDLYDFSYMLGKCERCIQKSWKKKDSNRVTEKNSLHSSLPTAFRWHCSRDECWYTMQYIHMYVGYISFVFSFFSIIHEQISWNSSGKFM